MRTPSKNKNEEILAKHKKSAQTLTRSENKMLRAQIRQMRSSLIVIVRKSKKMKQSDIAKLLNIRQSSFSLIETNGKNSIYLEKIAEILGIPFDLLKNPTPSSYNAFIHDYLIDIQKQNTQSSININTEARIILMAFTPNQSQLLYEILNGIIEDHADVAYAFAIEPLLNIVKNSMIHAS